MTKNAKDIAEELMFQAQHLSEQSDEFPEYKARNDAAEEKLNELARLFDNDDVDEAQLTEFNSLYVDDGAAPEWQAYKRVLESVGFGNNYATAEEFLDDAIIEMRTKAFA